jgi:hypothetical protein
LEIAEECQRDHQPDDWQSEREARDGLLHGLAAKISQQSADSAHSLESAALFRHFEL